MNASSLRAAAVKDGAVNPLGTALANLIGSTAEVLTSWQQAIVALVFELCLVGVMVIYEILGHSKQPAAQEARAGEKAEHRARATGEPTGPKSPLKPAVPKATSPPKEKTSVGSVSRFISENVSTAKDAKTEMRELIRATAIGAPQKAFAP